MKHYSKALCLTADARVSTPSGDVRIDSIEPGAQIYGYDEETSTCLTDTVFKVARSLHDKCAKVFFENGASFVITLDHPIYVEGKGWSVIRLGGDHFVYGVSVEQLVVGDVCVLYSNGIVGHARVTSIEIMKCAEFFYCFSTIKTHSFFANGILVRDVNIDFLTPEQLEANHVEVK